MQAQRRTTEIIGEPEPILHGTAFVLNPLRSFTTTDKLSEFSEIQTHYSIFFGNHVAMQPTLPDRQFGMALLFSR